MWRSVSNDVSPTDLIPIFYLFREISLSTDIRGRHITWHNLCTDDQLFLGGEILWLGHPQKASVIFAKYFLVENPPKSPYFEGEKLKSP